MSLIALLALTLSTGAVGDENAPDLSRSPQPKGSPAGWIRGEDYPNQSGYGSAQLTLIVDANGKAISCVITSSSGVPEFDAIACEKISARARFTPGTDRYGRPMVSQWKIRAGFGVDPATAIIIRDPN